MPGRVMRPRVELWWQALCSAGPAWITDSCGTMAAAIAFYASFSLAPTLVIVIAVAGFAFGAEAVQGRLFAEIAGLTGPDGAAVIQTMVANAWKSDRNGWTAVVSVAATVIGASATFAQLHDTVNQIWRAPGTAPATTSRPLMLGLKRLLRVRLMSFGLVIGIGFLLLVLLVLDTGMTLAIEWLWGADSVLHLAQQATVLLMLSAVFAALLRLLPDHHPRWQDVFGGAIVAAVLFTAGKSLFGLYLARAGTANAFGAAGSLAVVLMWLFYSAAVFLFGAEYAAALTRLAAGKTASPSEEPSAGARTHGR
ncbi:MAG: YihY/virulence factor BrkB family protein [Nevskia sp.]